MGDPAGHPVSCQVLERRLEREFKSDRDFSATNSRLARGTESRRHVRISLMKRFGRKLFSASRCRQIRAAIAAGSCRIAPELRNSGIFNHAGLSIRQESSPAKKCYR
jgi:hypothetical protein